MIKNKGNRLYRNSSSFDLQAGMAVNTGMLAKAMLKSLKQDIGQVVLGHKMIRAL